MCENTTLCKAMGTDMSVGSTILLMIFAVGTKTCLERPAKPWFLCLVITFLPILFRWRIVALSMSMPNMVYAGDVKPID